MKFIYLIIVVFVAMAVGYMAEPSMRLSLTGKPANFSKKAAKPKQAVERATPAEPSTTNSETPAAVVPETPPTVAVTPEVAPVETPVAPPAETPVAPAVETPAPLQVEASAPALETKAAEPEASVVKATPGQSSAIVGIMKASLAAKQISKFTASQVLEWEAGAASETIDGESYQIGNVMYQSETPFGTKNLPAKALIKDGKVVRWISPKSGMEIK